MTLAETVRQSIFEDAQNTFTDSALLGPPTVEFATYGRIPGGRRRTDARAGTIDQDPEFMSFLEALANPTTGRELTAEALAEIASGKPEKVTTTPLVQFLKDKKASKSKDAAAKAAKKQEAQSGKSKLSKELPEDVKKKGKENKLVERAAKEAVKILNRGAASKTAAGSSTAGQSSGEIATGPPKLDVTKVPGRQRSAVVAAHIRMLQRDLGLSPAQAHRQVRRDTADAQKAERAAAAEKAASESGEASSSSQAAPSPAIPTAPKGGPGVATSRRSRAKASNSADSEAGKQPSTAAPAPMVLLKKPETPQQSPAPPATAPAPTKPTPAAIARKPPVAVPSEGATQAFVKHANPSQGVTEPLLKEAMEQFGAVSMVEIDKRKGFAYVDFVDTEGLKKAMAANPISVAQGTVHVMQRKGTSLPPEKKPQHQAPHAPSRGGRGGRGGTIGRRGGRGGGRGGAGGAQGGSAEVSKAAATPAGPAT